MDKIIYPGYHDALIEQAAGQIETFFDGSDRNIKSAASSAIGEDMMRKHKPDDDHFGIHLIAMGSGESYGPNKNGDYWTRDGLVKRHSTFKTHGHFFREHRNKDPKQAIGKVAATAFNEPMDRVELIVHGSKRAAEEEYQRAKAGKPLGFSMSASVPEDKCLPAGTMIRMADGWKPVEEVVKGDEVISHTGTVRKVKETIHQVGQRSARCLKMAGSPFLLQLTDNHPVYAITPGQASGNQRQFVRKVTDDDGIVTGLNGWDRPAFVESRFLRPSDYILSPLGNGSESPDIDPWLLGVYLADGCVFGENAKRDHSGKWAAMGISWDLGYAKEAVKDRLLKLLPRIGNQPVVKDVPERNCWTVTWHDAQQARKILSLCGRTDTKQVPSNFGYWAQESLRDLLAGWLDGDGNWTSDKCQLRGSSSSVGLSRQLMVASWMARVPASVNASWVTSNFNPQGSWCHTFSWSRKYAQILTSRSARFSDVTYTEQRDAGSKSSFILQIDGTDYIAIRVEEVRGLELEETFNFSVQEDESYIAEEMAVHNCSICGYRAKSSSYYCSHLKYSMTQYLDKHAKFAYAINEQPTFFDISRVGNPADRIAYHLDYSFSEGDLHKAASARPFPYSDLLANMEGVVTRGRQRDPEVQGWLEKLAEEEDYLRHLRTDPDNVASDAKRHFATNVIPYAFPKSALTDEDVQSMRSVAPEMLWYEFAKRGSVLPFDVFFAYCTNQSLEETRKSAAFHYAWDHLLDQAFSKAANEDLDGQIEEDMKPASSIKVALCHVSDPIQKLMDRVAQDYSVDGDAVKQRIFRIRFEPRDEEKSASTEVEPTSEDKSLAALITKAFAVNRAALTKAALEINGENCIDAAETMLLASSKI